jgi:hypothetical protein
VSRSVLSLGQIYIGNTQQNMLQVIRWFNKSLVLIGATLFPYLRRYFTIAKDVMLGIDAYVLSCWWVCSGLVFYAKREIALTFPRIIAAVSLCGVWLTF